jgi:hypothetical protein
MLFIYYITLYVIFYCTSFGITTLSIVKRSILTQYNSKQWSATCLKQPALLSVITPSAISPKCRRVIPLFPFPSVHFSVSQTTRFTERHYAKCHSAEMTTRHSGVISPKLRRAIPSFPFPPVHFSVGQLEARIFNLKTNPRGFTITHFTAVINSAPQ